MSSTQISPISRIIGRSAAKSIITGSFSAAGDHFIMQNPHLQLNAYFGAAVAAGVFSASSVGGVISPYFPTSTPLGSMGKNLEARIVEIGCGTVGALALQRFVLNSIDYDYKQWAARVLIIGASDVCAETILDILEVV